jgi:hypothetical protein
MTLLSMDRIKNPKRRGSCRLKNHLKLTESPIGRFLNSLRQRVLQRKMKMMKNMLYLLSSISLQNLKREL